jgi:1-acyl-sn-glycerol-3-phosphate acyltransferase
VEILPDPPQPSLQPLVILIRGVIRFVLLVVVVVMALLHYWLTIRRRMGPDKVVRQVEWMHRLAGRVARIMSVRVEYRGTIPSEGLVVANHLSYTDIIMLASVAPLTFVAKAEVANWPIFGMSARCGGSVFVDRSRRGQVVPVAESMKQVLQAGVPLVLFAEGTSTNGSSVLPFKPALFAAVTDLNVPVTPCAIDYGLQGGSVANEVCYWGDHEFVPHVLNLFGKVGLSARVTFGEPRMMSSDRKEMARALHADVVALRKA